MSSLRVKTGRSDEVKWEDCDLTRGTAKPEHRWSLTLPNHLRSTVNIADNHNNPLVVFNSVFSGVLFGKAVTILAQQPSSLPAPFTSAFEIGSDYFNFALARAKNLLGAVESGYCPAPGIKAQKTNINIQPRIVPIQVIWANWVARMYEIARNDNALISIGPISGGDLQALEIITEATLEGHQSTVFLANPFGILYDTDTPPQTSYVATDRYGNQRHLATSEISRIGMELSDTISARQQSGSITIPQAANMYRNSLIASYNTMAPQLATSLYASETATSEHGLAPINLEQLYERMRHLPRGSTFIFRVSMFPDLEYFAASHRFSSLGIVDYNGDIRLVRSTLAIQPEMDEGEYRRLFNGGRITSGTSIQNFLISALPRAMQNRYHMADIYLVDRREPPPPPTTANVGTQTELSAGNCSESTQTGMSGDGAGISQYSVNFCSTSTGRCMDR